MKYTSKKIFCSLLTLCMMAALPLIAVAQDPGGGPDVPIDGGLSLLLAAGAAYGVKKYRDYKGNTDQDADSGLK